MFGYLLVDAILAGVIFWLCWRYRKFPRPVSLAAPVGAFFAIMAVPTVHAALAAAGATLPGMLAVAVIATAGTFITISEVLFGNRHHPVWTPVIGIVYGIALAVLVTDKALIGGQARQMVPASQAQLSQSITAAAPQHVMATSSLAQYRSTLIAVAVAVAVFALWLRRHHRKHQQPRAKPLTAHRKVIAAGRRASAITGGRKPQGWDFHRPSQPELPRGAR
jgi:hypothetical protein